MLFSPPDGVTSPPNTSRICQWVCQCISNLSQCVYVTQILHSKAQWRESGGRSNRRSCITLPLSHSQHQAGSKISSAALTLAARQRYWFVIQMCQGKALDILCTKWPWSLGAIWKTTSKWGYLKNNIKPRSSIHIQSKHKCTRCNMVDRLV